ncbi:hypothetical protein ACHAW6_010602 [Cyclotella cf. meneghiniana]
MKWAPGSHKINKEHPFAFSIKVPFFPHYFQIMHMNIGHHRLSNGHGNHSLGNVHRLMNKRPLEKKDVVVEDLSEKLIPILGQVKFAAIIHNLFTPQECANFIEAAEKKGFINALVHGPEGTEILRKDLRDSGRCIIDDEDLAQAWFDRMVQALDGSPVKKKLFDAYWLEDHEDQGSHRSLRAVGLNERLRFLRYHRGQFFGFHRDNEYTRGPEFGPRAGEESHVTFLLYLNDKMEGGQTRIESGGRYVDVIPETGSVLIFDQDIIHAAIPVSSGNKYCCRTDIMFAINTPLAKPFIKLSPREDLWTSHVGTA